jgi:Spy/CpxP family protein refolding chaperone
MLEVLVKELGLTADQQTQVKQILETHRQAMGNMLKELGEAASRPSREAMQKLTDLRQQLVAQLKAVLTEEQKAKLDALPMFAGPRPPMLDGQRIQEIVDKLQLTDAQKQQIAGIQKTARESAQATDDLQAKAKIWRTALEDIAKLLTPEQKAKVEEALRAAIPAGPLAMFADLKLTDDQRQQLQKIAADALEQARTAEPGQARAIFEAARENIIKNVLSDEQRKLLEERRREGPGPRGPGGPGGPPPGPPPGGTR